MAQFTFKCTGNDGVDNAGVLEADDQAKALAKLDQLYGIERDAKGVQTNEHLITVSLINQAEFDAIQSLNGKSATHKHVGTN